MIHTGKDNFTIVLGFCHVRNQFYFTENSLDIAYKGFIRPAFAALRKNPFSLEEMAKVKIATSGVDLESLNLPIMIKNELKKYQDLNKTFIGLVDWQYWLNWCCTDNLKIGKNKRIRILAQEVYEVHLVRGPYGTLKHVHLGAGIGRFSMKSIF